MSVPSGRAPVKRICYALEQRFNLRLQGADPHGVFAGGARQNVLRNIGQEFLPNGARGTQLRGTILKQRSVVSSCC